MTSVCGDAQSRPGGNFYGSWNCRIPSISSGSTQPEVTALVGVSLLFPTPGKAGFPGPCGSSHVLATDRRRLYFRCVVTRETWPVSQAL